MSRRTKGSSPSGGIQVATGTYTGNGAAFIQAIVGVGFRPRYAFIYPQTRLASGTHDPSWKATVDGLFSYAFGAWGPSGYYVINNIISLDADGFTVTGATVNVLNAVYSYLCLG